jgi:hypothetical protein
MDLPLFEKLHARGLISNSSYERVKSVAANPLFSLHWELKTLLYLGVLLLASGLGIIVYKNIDTIGHQVILVFTALVSGLSFLYCFKNKRPFSTRKVDTPNAFFDYILLLGCLTFVTCIGYLQFQFNFFGNRFGLATFIPMVVLFFAAYYFDHLAILSLAITNLAAWAGITVTPLQILKANDFNNNTLIFTGLALGIFLISAGIVTRKLEIKPHFAFTFTNFGMHIFFISCLAGLFHFEKASLPWFLALCAAGYYFYKEAARASSFYYIIILTLYVYIGLTYVVTRQLFYVANLDVGGIYLLFIYFIVSAIFIVRFLMRINRKLKSHARL